MRALLVSLLVAFAAAPHAQPLRFGSADDPLEWGSAFRSRDAASVTVLAGPAYLPDTWRTAVRADAEVQRGRWSMGVGGTVHPGAGGLYGPEADETYDALRLLRYARLNPTPQSRVYLRAGPTERVTLGTGGLVRLYRTTTAWDERTVGVEGAARSRTVRVAAFADDVRLDGVVGGEVGVTTGLDVGPARDLGLTLGAVHDLGLSGLSGDSSLTGLEATVRGTLVVNGFAALSPFVTHARYLDHGATLGAGVDLGAENLGDVVRARARLAAFVSSSQFVPGHVGPFYSINNAAERIVADEPFYSPTPRIEPVGTPLDSLGSGVDVVVDLRLIAFGRLEVSQHVRRHIGPDAASAYSIRLAGRLPQGGHLEFSLERQGFRGLFDLIGSLGDQNALLLDVAAPVGRRGFVFVRSRYGYRRLTAADGPDFSPGTPPRFLVERRFEPLVGLRLVLD